MSKGYYQYKLKTEELSKSCKNEGGGLICGRGHFLVSLTLSAIPQASMYSMDG